MPVAIRTPGSKDLKLPEYCMALVRSNATAAFIIDQLKTETTKEAILDAMCKKYDAPRAVMAEDVDMVLANLKKIGALDA